MRDDPCSTRCYARLLRLLPADFRASHGAETAQVFDELWRTRRGPAAGARLWAAAVWDVARWAWRVRTTAWKARARGWRARARGWRAPKSNWSAPDAGVSSRTARDRWTRDAIMDIRYAVRTLGKTPSFTTASIATLALAIGLNTIMFSVLNAVLLRQLPYRSPDRLAMLWTERPMGNLRENRSAYWNIEQWRRQSHSFEGLAVFDPLSVILTSAEGAESISAVRVSPNFFSLVGVQPVRGRTFSMDEAERRQPVALISHGFWQTRFGGSPDAIGASISLDGRPSRIIGILPAGFWFPAINADVWQPHTMFSDWEARQAVRGEDSWFVVGRIRPDVRVEQAQTEMSAIARRLDGQLPAADRNRGVRVVALSHYVVGPRSRLSLWLLIAAVSCVLLIAAANVASLSLARSVGRAREMAIRAALGASRLRMVRQLLTEGVVLAVVSGLVGVLLALAGIRVIRAVEGVDLARLNEAGLDLRVLGWALAISTLTGILVGLAPATMLWRRNLRSSAEERGRGVADGVAARRIRRALVVAEFALALVLLAGAGLLVRSWWSVERVDPGFRTDGVLAMGVGTPVFMEAAQRADFFRRVLEEVESLPRVEDAGFTSELFISRDPARIVTLEGAVRTTSERLHIRIDEVGMGFFTTVGTPLLRGRLFSADDGPDGPRVAITNEAMARRLWPGRNPVGMRFKHGPSDSDAPWMTVVGVVGDMHRQGLERDPIPQMFQPLAQVPARVRGGLLLVRTSLDDPPQMAATLREAVRRVEKHALLTRVVSLADELGVFLVPRRFQTSLVVGFSTVALLMAAIGIYGLMQYSVERRTQEIGLRTALGAHAGGIFRMVIGEGLMLSLIGLALGLVGAAWVGQAGSRLLFGVTATDPWTFMTASLLLVAVAAAACYFPARRAMKVDPMVALRQE